MKQDRLQFLLTRYSQNQCSAEELRELEDWFHARDLDNGDFEDWLAGAGGKEALSSELFEDFLQMTQVHEKKPAVRLWIGIAASILVVMSTGVLLFLKKQASLEKNLYVKESSVIKPGSDQATLTLSDGSEIMLTNSKEGHLATENDIDINKDTKDRVSYEHHTNAKVDQKLVFNTITTPRGGRYAIRLADGTDVILDAESSITFPVAFNGHERKVSVTGQVYFKVVHDERQPFRVMAKGQMVEDLGTSFNVNAYSDNPSLKVTLVEGKVNVGSKLKYVSMLPGEQAEVMDGQQNINVRKVDVNEVVAWREGWFVFHNESIMNVLKEVSRWYDVDIKFAGPVNEKRFGGTISRYKEITEVLDNLKITGGINYKIEGRRVILMN